MEAPSGAAPDAAVVDAPPAPVDPWANGPALGARRLTNGDVEVRVRAPNATRIDVSFFEDAKTNDEKVRATLAREGDVFRAVVPAASVGNVVFYALRSFGPNGDAEVDADGNRMNPDKLILDPYGLEVSHDPGAAAGAAKSVLVTAPAPLAGKPTRTLRDDVVYEVHVRGLTMNDPSVPEAERGTYAGAARKARYLRELGVTAVEFLPLHETPNDQNDRSADANGDNYWGYATLSFFAPDRRYAMDRSPGGPTHELRAMVDAFHAEGIKVFDDVVYNHTAGDSFRLLDNRTFYEIGDDATKYVNSNGVGPNFNTANPVVGDLVLASLKYWQDALGFDGFRFDLASIVGNECTRGCFRFGKGGLLQRIADELPEADLIAEPWGLAPGSYQVGGFPKGWAEWNDRYRDAFRRDLNRLGVDAVPPREIARRLAGSPDLYADDGRPPSASINFIVAHDGMTLADLFAYDGKRNDQAWPWGPSNGGTDNDLAFSHGGDPKRQRAVTRAALLLLAVSAGVPMITGGDERLRTLRGNNNPYNLDSTANWLDWTPNAERDAFATFTKNALGFRAVHPELRPSQHWKDQDVRFVRDDGRSADATYLDAGDRHYLGMSVGDVLVAYNGWSGTTNATLPSPPPGKAWALVADTSEAAEAWGNWHASPVASTGAHALGRRSVALFVAR